MTLVGIFGVLFSLAAYPFALRRHDSTRAIAFFALFFVHLAATVFYYVWQQQNTSDAPLYYYDPFGFYQQGFGLSMIWVVFLVQSLKLIIGGTYLDYFLLFQATGFWAIAIMLRIFQEIYDDLGLEQPVWTYLLLFLPSLHFWTSAIGKDGPLALGSAMTAWAALSISRRYMVFLIGVGIMVLFRPHIALMAIVSVAIALAVDKQTTHKVRLGLGAVVLVAAVIVGLTVRATFVVDVTSAESIGQFVSAQAEISKELDTGTAVLNASYPVRLLSLMFRPFFFDAGGALGLVASMENVLVLLIVATFARHFALFQLTFRTVLFFRYAAIYSAVVILLLAVVYYNVGLGLRQRTMALPTLLSMYVAMWALIARRQRPLVVVTA